MSQSGDSALALPEAPPWRWLIKGHHLQPLRGLSRRDTREDTREKGRKTNIKWKWDRRDFFFPRWSSQNWRSNGKTAPLEGNQDYCHTRGAFKMLQIWEDTAKNFTIKIIFFIFQVLFADFKLFSFTFHLDRFPFVLKECAKIQSQTRNFIFVLIMSKKVNMFTWVTLGLHFIQPFRQDVHFRYIIISQAPSVD